MQPQEYDKKSSFGPWTILSVYLPFNVQRLPEAQQTQGLSTLILQKQLQQEQA